MSFMSINFSGYIDNNDYINYSNYYLLFFKILLHKIHHLLGDGLHASLAGMAPLLVDVVEFDEGQTVVTADDTHRLGMFRLELGVEDEIDAGHGIVLLDDTAKACHSGTEEPEVVVGPVSPLVIADEFTRPRIVGDAAR